MPKQKTSAPQQVYRLKITLRDVRPPVWRRVEVAGTTTLHQLHCVIQEAMGWTDSHLHQVEVEGESYSEPEFGLDDFGDRSVKNERRVRLDQLSLRPKQKFTYEYDFGDDWRHEIMVEKISGPEARVSYPRCLAGKRACPPEDCGGAWGLRQLPRSDQG